MYNSDNIPKLAFFDIDGTLSIPRYPVEGNVLPGGSSEWWLSYCKNDPYPYKLCGVPKNIVQRLDFLQQHETELFVLSQESFEICKKAKMQFIQDRYSKYFDNDHILFVNDDCAKVIRMSGVASEKNVPLNLIEYWDDKFDNVLDATIRGINACHISYLLEEFTLDKS